MSLPLSFLILTLIITLTSSWEYCGTNIANSNVKPDKEHEDHLKLVQVIIRHGARTPVGKPCYGIQSDNFQCELTHSERPSFNDDAYVYNKIWMEDRNFYKGTCGIGILTSLGYHQQITNGMFLRNSFGKFLPDRITGDIFDREFFIRSTDYPRTFLSGESLLTGLYPPALRDDKFEIYIHTMDGVMENLLVNPHTCPKQGYYYDQFLNSQLWKNHQANVGVPLAKKLAALLNISDHEEIDILAQGDCWMSARCNGYPLVDSITDKFVQEVVDYSTFFFSNGFTYPDRIATAKVGLGNFVQEFYQRFLDTLNKVDEKKMVLYSAHDTTIMPFLISLGIWDGAWPPYGSIITSELYNNGTVTVRFTYNGKILYLPGCDEYCPFDHFRYLVEQVTPEREDCSVPSQFKKRKMTDIYTTF